MNEDGNFVNSVDIEVSGTPTAYATLSITSKYTPPIFGFMADVFGFEFDTEHPWKQLLMGIQRLLYVKTGLISPYINVGSLNYVLVESNDFD